MNVNTTSAGRSAERPKARRMLVLRHDSTPPLLKMCESTVQPQKPFRCSGQSGKH